MSRVLRNNRRNNYRELAGLRTSKWSLREGEWHKRVDNQWVLPNQEEKIQIMEKQKQKLRYNRVKRQKKARFKHEIQVLEKKSVKEEREKLAMPLHGPNFRRILYG